MQATTRRRSMPSAARRRGRGIYEGPGISIKLSALHPRYSRAQIERVQAELYPRLKDAGGAGAAATTSASTSMPRRPTGWRSSLDLLERLCFEPELEGWNGIGFVVQAYQKRAVFTIDWLIDLARRRSHRLMVRLVKGAYWDGEIKRAQLDGLGRLSGVHAAHPHRRVLPRLRARGCWRRPDAAFPQFATHNALTLATIHAMAGENFYAGQYEFQCLHGMGETAVRGGRRPRQAQPAVPHLCAGRHARDASGLSGAPAAGERRQHLVRQPDRRSRRVARSRCSRDPVEQALALQPVGAAARPRSPCRATCSARARQLEGARSRQRAACWRRLQGDSSARAGVAAAGAGRRGRATATARALQQSGRPRRDVVGTVVEATPEPGRCAPARPRRGLDCPA